MTELVVLSDPSNLVRIDGGFEPLSITVYVLVDGGTPQVQVGAYLGVGAGGGQGGVG